MEIKDNITKQELVDYAVNKKVQEIEAIKEGFSKEKEVASKERDVIKKEIKEEREKATIVYVEQEYKDVIEAMAKKGNTHTIHTREKRNQNDLIAEVIYSTGNIVLEFQKNTKEDVERRGGFGHPMRDFFDMAHLCNSIIIIDRDEVTSDKLVELNDKLKLVEENLERLNDLLNDCNKDISNIKSKRETIKSQIIEQALSNTKEGKKMLVALQNIDFGEIKMLGSTNEQTDK